MFDVDHLIHSAENVEIVWLQQVSPEARCLESLVFSLLLGSIGTYPSGYISGPTNISGRKGVTGASCCRGFKWYIQ